MHILVTGGSGYVGSHLLPLLLAAGHSVTALSRSPASDAKLAHLGATPVRGTIEDTALLTGLAARADAVVHLAMNHDGMGGAEAYDFAHHSGVSSDAALALAAGLSPGKVLVNTSGTLVGAMSGHGQLLLETDPVESPHRPTHYAALLEQGLVPIVVRLSPTTHGDDDKGFMKNLVRIAKQHGVSAYIGQGENKWTAAHVRDSAHLYLLALETRQPGFYHAAAESGVTLRAIAEAIGARHGLPVSSIPPEQASEHFGPFMAYVVGLDAPASSELTRERTGWTPKERSLVEDIALSEAYAE